MSGHGAYHDFKIIGDFVSTNLSEVVLINVMKSWGKTQKHKRENKGGEHMTLIRKWKGKGGIEMFGRTSEEDINVLV